MVGRVEEQETNIFRESHTRSPIAAVASKNNSQHWKQVVAGKLGGEKITALAIQQEVVILLWRCVHRYFLFHNIDILVQFGWNLQQNSRYFSAMAVSDFPLNRSEGSQNPCWDRLLVVTMVEPNHPPIQFSWNGVGQDCFTWWFGCKMWAFSENSRRSCWISIKIWIVFLQERERWSNFI